MELRHATNHTFSTESPVPPHTQRIMISKKQSILKPASFGPFQKPLPRRGIDYSWGGLTLLIGFELLFEIGEGHLSYESISFCIIICLFKVVL